MIAAHTDMLFRIPELMQDPAFSRNDARLTKLQELEIAIERTFTELFPRV
jgi:hypothetical protein